MRMRSYHDALPGQVLVHKDVVSWETPKKAQVRHFVHVALKPWRESLRDHPPGMGEPTPVLKLPPGQLGPLWLWGIENLSKQILLLFLGDEVRDIVD